MTPPISVDDEAKAIIASSWHFYKASFAELVRIFWVPFLVLALCKLFAIINIRDMTIYSSLVLFSMVVTPWLNAVAILFFYAKSNDRSIEIGLLFRTAVKYWPTLLGILFILGGIGGVGISLFQVGLWPLIIPALWIIVRLILSDMIYVLEKPSLTDTLKLSFSQTNNKFGLITLCLTFVGLPMLLIKILLLSITQYLGNPLIMHLIIELVSSFAFLMINVILYRLYMVTMDNRTAIE